MRSYSVFIMASRPGGALYVGMTDDLRRRVELHRARQVPDHAAKYNITKLVWFEQHPTRAAAAERERRIKGWRRLWNDLNQDGVPPRRHRCAKVAGVEAPLWGKRP